MSSMSVVALSGHKQLETPQPAQNTCGPEQDTRYPGAMEYAKALADKELIPRGSVRLITAEFEKLGSKVDRITRGVLDGCPDKEALIRNHVRDVWIKMTPALVSLAKLESHLNSI